MVSSLDSKLLESSKLLHLFAASVLEQVPGPVPERVPEADLVTDDPEAVTEYQAATAECGPLHSIYAFHLLNLLTLIRDGDTVLDFGSGPGNFLCWLAACYPRTKFIGVDLSTPMVARASENVRRLGLKNISFIEGNILEASSLNLPKANIVISNFCFHHLPDVLSLHRAMSELNKLIAEDGGVYLSDVTRPRWKKTISILAYDYRHLPYKRMVEDYRSSLASGYSKAELMRAMGEITRAKPTFYNPRFASVFSLIRTGDRAVPSAEVLSRAKQQFSTLDSHALHRLKALELAFKISGLRINPRP